MVKHRLATSGEARSPVRKGPSGRPLVAAAYARLLRPRVAAAYAPVTKAVTALTSGLICVRPGGGGGGGVGDGGDGGHGGWPAGRPLPQPSAAYVGGARTLADAPGCAAVCWATDRRISRVPRRVGPRAEPGRHAAWMAQRTNNTMTSGQIWALTSSLISLI